MTDKALTVIHQMFAMGFLPIQIKELMEDNTYLKHMGISPELAKEIHFSLCSNWKKVLEVGC